MSHLREQISAFVDGELTGSDLDRASEHLAACGQCRAEAAALRQLKRELRALAASEPSGMARDEAAGHAAVPADEALTRRLLAMGGPGGPVPSRRTASHAGRYMVWSAVSLVVVGIGAVAFSMGGTSADPGPKITPQLQMFSVQHAINSGDVPFPEPTQAPATRP